MNGHQTTLEIKPICWCTHFPGIIEIKIIYGYTESQGSKGLSFSNKKFTSFKNGAMPTSRIVGGLKPQPRFTIFAQRQIGKKSTHRCFKLGFAWEMLGTSDPNIFSQMVVKDGDGSPWDRIRKKNTSNETNLESHSGWFLKHTNGSLGHLKKKNV